MCGQLLQGKMPRDIWASLPVASAAELPPPLPPFPLLCVLRSPLFHTFPLLCALRPPLFHTSLHPPLYQL